MLSCTEPKLLILCDKAFFLASLVWHLINIVLDGLQPTSASALPSSYAPCIIYPGPSFSMDTKALLLHTYTSLKVISMGKKMTNTETVLDYALPSLSLWKRTPVLVLYHFSPALFLILHSNSLRLWFDKIPTHVSA